MEEKDVREYRFKNGKYGFSMLNLGCAITSITCPNKNQVEENVVLPYESFDQMRSSTSFLGLTVGRFANRIGGASFSLGAKRYSLPANDGPNQLHGGPGGMWSRLWDITPKTDGFLAHLCVSEKDDSYPGTLDALVSFTMSSEGVFSIQYEARCSESCPVNLTNHSYFNLSGKPDTLIDNHILTIKSHSVVETAEGLIPTGKLFSVENTPYDFRTPKAIGKDISKAKNGGYDDAFVIEPSQGFRFCARAEDPASGRVMEVYTDMPAVQFYSGNFLNPSTDLYSKRCGFCLETEFYPDCVNHPSFPSCILKPGEVYQKKTEYRFLVKGEENE